MLFIEQATISRKIMYPAGADLMDLCYRMQALQYGTNTVTQYVSVPCPSELPNAPRLAKVQPVLEALATRERQEAFRSIFEQNVWGYTLLQVCTDL